MTDAAVGSPPTPYKGLSSFGESDLDALLFFGRDRETEVITANIVAARLTILYGPSGVGKTSLLRAGVSQRLRREGGAVVLLSNWSDDPSRALLAAVADQVPWAIPGASDDPPQISVAEAFSRWTSRLATDLYVILDQFEEYFLYHEEGGPFAEFADVIRSRDVRANFLISIREDALAQLDAFKAQIPNLFSNSLRLDRLDRRAASRAILGPLERYATLTPVEGPVEMEPGLADEILDSVTAGRIQLGAAGRGGAEEADDDGRIEAPYLQLVLERLWHVERDRGSSVLQLETLHELGGATRIVEEHLERAMAGLSSHEKDTAAAMYNHLVTPSGTKIAHRAGDLARYAAVDEAEAGRVLDRLARERIVRTAEDGAAGLQYEIFHDVLADAVLGWRAQHEADRRLEAERLEASRRHRRLLALAGASLLAMAVLAGIAVYALAQRTEAQENAREARAGELVAQAAATLPGDPERSVELALDASRIVRSPAVEDMLRKALTQLRGTSVTSVSGPPGEMALSSDGSLLAVASGGTARIYGDGGATLLTTLRHPKVEAAVFSPDASRIATVGRDGKARIWTRNGRLVRVLVHPGQVQSAAFSRDGRLLTVSQQRVIRVFDRRGELAFRVTQPSLVMAARFSPDSALFATGGSDKVARLWDGRTGRLLRTFGGHVGRVGDVAFSPDGELLATGSTDGTARVWQDDGSLVTILPGHEGFVSRVEFSPDGTLVATASQDRRARIFDAESPTLRATLPGHTEAVTDLAFSGNGAALATASTDGTVRLWDAPPFPVPRLIRRHSEPVRLVAFRSDGRRILSVPWRSEYTRAEGLLFSSHGDPRMQPDSTLAHALERVPQGPIEISFSRDGRVAASFHWADSKARIWSVQDGVLRRTLDLSRFDPAWLTISPDGRRLAAAGSKTTRIWDAETGKVSRKLIDHKAGITSLSFSPDSRLILTTSHDHNARLSDAVTGEQVWLLTHSTTVVGAAFSADGRWIAIALPRHVAVVDARTGQRILLFDPRDTRLLSVASSPAGWRFATGGLSGAVRVYDCRLCGGIDDLVALAKRRLARLRLSS